MELALAGNGQGHNLLLSTTEASAVKAACLEQMAEDAKTAAAALAMDGKAEMPDTTVPRSIVAAINNAAPEARAVTLPTAERKLPYLEQALGKFVFRTPEVVAGLEGVTRIPDYDNDYVSERLGLGAVAAHLVKDSVFQPRPRPQ